jgi:acetoin utilization deacetylase AcuC-like enzyme
MVLLLTDDLFLEHNPGPGHPESAERLKAIRAALESPAIDGVIWGTPTPASRAAIERVHDAAYVTSVEKTRGLYASFDPDTGGSPATVDAAYLSAGSAIAAVTEVMRGEQKRAFSLGRPPGHHAERSRAMGFCIFNNVAVAAAHARAELGCERVLIVDWDVHHGNGTQHIFFDRNDVLVFNTLQWPHYPGTGVVSEVGSGPGEGFNVNVAFPSGCGDADYLAAFQTVLTPIARAFKPDLILVSAGFDAHRADPLGGMRVTERGFAALAGIVVSLAEELTGGRLMLTLEGGYELDALAASVRAVVEVLAGATPPTIDGGTGRGKFAVADARRTMASYWPMG